MPTQQQVPSNNLDGALARYGAGFDPTLIELTEHDVFPHLISASPSTGRKARVTGTLLGKPAPRYIKRGRSVRYRLSDVLTWLADADAYTSSADMTAKEASQ